jgi:hypothetical protein
MPGIKNLNFFFFVFFLKKQKWPKLKIKKLIKNFLSTLIWNFGFEIKNLKFKI